MKYQTKDLLTSYIVHAVSLLFHITKKCRISNQDINHAILYIQYPHMYILSSVMLKASNISDTKKSPYLLLLCCLLYIKYSERKWYELQLLWVIYILHSIESYDFFTLFSLFLEIVILKIDPAEVPKDGMEVTFSIMLGIISLFLVSWKLVVTCLSFSRFLVPLSLKYHSFYHLLCFNSL